VLTVRDDCRGSYVRGDEDIPQVYVLGRPLGTKLMLDYSSMHTTHVARAALVRSSVWTDLTAWLVFVCPCVARLSHAGSTREVMDAVATGQLEARLRLTRSQRHFYATH
jgi:hypothetical protein